VEITADTEAGITADTEAGITADTEAGITVDTEADITVVDVNLKTLPATLSSERPVYV